MLDYEAEAIVTSISKHIQENFYQIVNRYVNIMLNKDELESRCQNKEQIKAVRRELEKVKKDILLNRDRPDINPEHKALINNFRTKIINDMILEKSVIYSVKSAPLKFLAGAIRMSIESENELVRRLPPEERERGQQVKVINAFLFFFQLKEKK